MKYVLLYSIFIIISILFILQNIYTFNKKNRYNLISNITVLPIIRTIPALSQEIDFKTDNIRLYLYNPSIDVDINNDFIVITHE